MPSRKRKNPEAPKIDIVPQEQNRYEGERLDRLLQTIDRGIESAKLCNRALPEKIWLKQQFSIGVNDVTRLLERMAPVAEMGASVQQSNGKQSTVQLQAILIACDCNPRWLTKHLPSLAASRTVPVIFISDKKRGSSRLGELVKLKTAIAIGVKARGNAINQVVEEILHGNDSNSEQIV